MRASSLVLEEGKWSLDSATLGMLAGLVMITPAGGFVGLTDALFLGIIGSTLSRQMLKFKFTSIAAERRWVDPADVFTTHAFGGLCATLMTGVFASREVAAYDGATDIVGGVLHDGNIRQLAIQLVEGLLGGAWSFGASFIFIALIDCVPGFEVLATDDEVMGGMDASQMLESLSGEHALDEDEYEPFHKPVQLV